MCGVLYVRSAQPIPLEQHLDALQTLVPRGPDFSRYQHRDNTFIAQTVLHITGTNDYYQRDSQDFLSYNGEIYNYKWFGSYDTDTEAVHHAVLRDTRKFRYFEGPWAWAWTNFETVLYAADPQGERCLYHYQDDNILIVASEVTAILKYVKCQPQPIPYNNKCWTMVSQTPWAGITRCEPGVMYRDGEPTQILDSIWSWIKPNSIDVNTASQQFETIWQRACSITRTEEPATLSYSGGMDSQLIDKNSSSLKKLAIDIVGKDPIVAQLDCRKIQVTEQAWAHHYKDLTVATRMPAQTWSYVGKWLIAKHADTRIIFTGLAADELFGGYDLYQTIDYNVTGSHSPYSSDDHDKLWNRCLDVYNGDPRPATLLMDYWYQVVGVDAPGLDRLGGQWGKETRNPFMLKTIIEFALCLPWDLRVGQHPKQLLRTYYQRTINQPIAAKQGFAGHANDSAAWLDVNIISTGDRYQDWKQIVQQSFSNYTRA